MTKQHIESDHQIALIKWMRSAAQYYPQLKLLHSSLNGVRMSMSRARIAKAEGMLSGIPDLFLPVPMLNIDTGKWQHGLYIEMKKPKTASSGKGTVSPKQKVIIEQLRAVGYQVDICYGWQEAKACILRYVGIEND